MLKVCLFVLTASVYVRVKVYGQLTNCWLQSCTILKNLEAFSGTIITQQEQLTTQINSGGLSRSVTTFLGDIETNLTAKVGADIAATETSVINALNSSEGNIIAAVNSSISNKLSSVSEAIAFEVGASEGNVISALISELETSDSKVIAAVLAEVETVQKNLTAKVEEVLTSISSIPTVFSPGFTVDANVKEIQIELDIFAGVVNPTWTITNDSSHFLNLLAVVTGAKSSSLPSRAGYRGFKVTIVLDDGTSVSQTFGYATQPSSTLETVLLNSNDGLLSSDVVSIAAAAINGLATPDLGGPQASLDPATIDNFNPKCGKAVPCSEPEFNNALWTSASDNCYNYAVNIATGTYAQPGRAAGTQYTSLTGEVVRGAAVLDGLMDHNDTASGQFPTSNNCLMALAIIPGIDFHFYRRDSDGNWSHKPGPRAPNNQDNAGQIIIDPRTADIAPYKFVRFLSACPRKVNIN